jgi:hypothetical protein
MKLSLTFLSKLCRINRPGISRIVPGAGKMGRVIKILIRFARVFASCGVCSGLAIVKFVFALSVAWRTLAWLPIRALGYAFPPSRGGR